MNVICLIPARGGSKGLPGKNIRQLAGKPLIAHTIEQALSAELIDKVYVTTDDHEIADVASEFGAQVIDRPKVLANDAASSESALEHALLKLQTEVAHIDYVVFLQCTSPIRSSNEIDEAVNKIQQDKADSLLSVTRNHRFLWKIVNGQANSINYDYKNRQRRQDFEIQYQENGSIYIFKPEVLLKHNNRLGGKISIYEMPEESAVEIDSELDFGLIERFLLNKLNGC